VLGVLGSSSSSSSGGGQQWSAPAAVSAVVHGVLRALGEVAAPLEEDDVDANELLTLLLAIALPRAPGRCPSSCFLIGRLQSILLYLVFAPWLAFYR